ncbi:hypothetical protein OSC52_02725 [Clostridium pasteurianum]|nr:hypothetical protein [Clostridium pasteurianum]UZW14778.1 hypothetical protein OSC52_02725 [Clostridium pasteurianum]
MYICIFLYAIIFPEDKYVFRLPPSRLFISPKKSCYGKTTEEVAE